MFKNDKSDRKPTKRFDSEELIAIRERKGKLNKTKRTGKAKWETKVD